MIQLDDFFAGKLGSGKAYYNPICSLIDQQIQKEAKLKAFIAKREGEKLWRTISLYKAL